MRTGHVPQVAPCFVSHNLALGGAQIAVLRMINALPQWVRERTSLYVQADDMPLLEPALAAGFSCKTVTTKPIDDPSCYVLSYGNLKDLPERPTSLLLHSWDDAGWRFINKAYGDARGWRIAGVSQHVLNRFAPFVEKGGHEIAGVLPPPVTEFCRVKGRRNQNRIVVAWMGRPLESKGLFALPYLLKKDERLVIRCFTGAITGGHPYTRRVQTEAMEKFLALCDKLGVRNRLDLRPLDFNAFNYQDRLKGCHALLGNSEREGFLLTAAEALSCGVPVVVTRDCGVTEFVQEGVNGCIIDWDADPRKLATKCWKALQTAIRLSGTDAMASAKNLSTGALYQQMYSDVLAKITHTSLRDLSAPRVTVGLRIHKGMRIDHLDQAASSLASQTYRNFKTVLLVDGPWEYGEQLAARYDLPLICTGEEPDITHCSWLHRQAVAQCDTEFYKPLDYDDQLMPTYLERAVATLDREKADVYGCLLTSLENGEFSSRWWPNKPISTMFTGNSDHNQLPHSSVMMRAEAARRAGNYNERAVGLGADDYQLWYRLYQTGVKFVRDDEVRNVVYRIHEKNSLKIRKARYGTPQTPAASASTPSKAGKLITGAAAASLALFAAPALGSDTKVPAEKKQVTPAESKKKSDEVKNGKSDKKNLIPPHS
jgi:glycosyltransferase involved in cell wall biosynthesis